MSYDDDERELDKVRKLVRTRGVRAAAMALIDVCEDKKAPAPARSTAGTSLFRAAGMFGKVEDPGTKDIAEMSGDEIRRRIAQLRADAKASDAADDEDDDEAEDDDLFE